MYYYYYLILLLLLDIWIILFRDFSIMRPLVHDETSRFLTENYIYNKIWFIFLHFTFAVVIFRFGIFWTIDSISTPEYLVYFYVMCAYLLLCLHRYLLIICNLLFLHLGVYKTGTLLLLLSIVIMIRVF